MACFLINLTLYYSIEIASDEIYFGSNLNSYCEQTDFAKSREGFITNAIVIFLRDVITLIVEILCSVLVIYYYKKYEKISLHTLVARLNQNKNNDNSNSSGSQIRPVNETTARQRANNERNIRKKEKGKQLLLMTIILSIFSFVTHIIAAFALVFLVLIYSKRNITFYSIVAFGSFIMIFKHFSTIFIFYFFNVNFKKQLIKIFFK